MELKKLDESFYNDNPKIIQALDFDQKTQQWSENKVRGHGIVSITIDGLTFAIPVRSYIKHKASFILEVNTGDRSVKGMGLDYSKAMLIRDDKHVTQDVFVLKSKDAGKKLLGKEDHITKQFDKYVNRYIKAVQKDDQRVLNSNEYRFTTLVNYHTELGL
ncbi:type III toxin-antitoxin system TenpIN family toxin [Acinetobacter venetianus]|uniref:type III toxin-antitoxin system TenpIN family toxin n=1 Tax=Acinetobacter venetianus TaxID=52133 RepID=UPI003A901EF2